MVANREKTKVEVAKVSELPPGQSKIITVGRREVGVYNVGGQYRAVLNICPHELAPVCKGKVVGTRVPSKPNEYKWGRDGEILQCPWHGWEFDLKDGKSLHEPHKCHLKTYEIQVEQETVFLIV
ncbi:MAG: Rieske (2Fe-2S) protein [Planctomycetes bacterium]|nr:Rieske (2Fe-2S) protein [Planctomycetota bacterium]